MLNLDAPSSGLELTDRPARATLFRTPERNVDAAGFVSDAQALAATLPEARHVANLCQDRYWFAVGLAASLLRGQISLLFGDPSPGTLARLAREYPGAYALADANLTADALPLHLLTSGTAALRCHCDTVPKLPADQPAIVVLTSGTTGHPVGTRKCWGELVARSRAAARQFGLQETDTSTVIPTVPAAHMYGLETSVLLPLHAPTATWCGSTFFPADIAAALERAPGRRILITTPLHMRALLQAPRPGRPPETVISATAPLEPALAGAVEASWDTSVLEIFGATEVGSVASRRTLTDDAWTPYPGVMVEDGGDCPIVRAPYAEPRALADRIEYLANGRFRLLGRSADLIKLGGRRASLLGLGRILAGIAGVREAIFLAPDDLDSRPTARLIAFAVAPGHTVTSLIEALRPEIDPVFLPRPLVLLDRMPRNALGKLPRMELLVRLDAEQHRDE